MNATTGPSREHRAQIIDRVLAAIDEHYLLPERTDQIAADLRARQAAGAYSDLDGSALAAELTTDLRRASGDDLLGVRFTARSEHDMTRWPRTRTRRHSTLASNASSACSTTSA
jgi:hypothetical protein